jgi:hypothetical protein
MARRINILLSLVGFPAFFLAIALKFEFELSVMRITDLPYQQEIFLVTAGIMLMVMIPFMLSRWTSSRILKRQNNLVRYRGKFQTNGLKWIMIYGAMESLFSALIGGTMVLTEPQAMLPGALLVFRAVENILFLMLNKHLFGISLSNDHLVVAARGFRAIPLHAIKKAESRYDELHLITKTDGSKVIPLGALSKEDQLAFFNSFTEVAKAQGIYLQDDVRNLAVSY